MKKLSDLISIAAMGIFVGFYIFKGTTLGDIFFWSEIVVLLILVYIHRDIILKGFKKESSEIKDQFIKDFIDDEDKQNK